MSKHWSSPRFRFTGAAVLLVLLIFLLPAVREGDRRLYLLAAVIPASLLFFLTVPARLFSLDRMLLSLSLYLCTIGILALAVSSPDEAFSQGLRCAAGVAALITGAVLLRILSPSPLNMLVSAFLGLLMLAVHWLSPSASMPLTGFSVALLLISFSACLSLYGGMAALLPGIACAVLLLFQGLIIETALWCAAVLLLLWAADGRLIVLFSAAAAFTLLYFAGRYLLPAASVQSAAQDYSPLNVLLSGNLFGPASPDAADSLSLSSDMPLYSLAGHYGLVFTGLTLLLYLPLLLRGISVASCARTRFHAVLAMGCVLLLGTRTLTSLLAVFEVLPLPLKPPPLLTVSLPDLCAQMLFIGMLCGISGRNEADLAEDAHLAMLAK